MSMEYAFLHHLIQYLGAFRMKNIDNEHRLVFISDSVAVNCSHVINFLLEFVYK